jgi:16S rRNA (adenine1518-N6/adenine1519-N6)-dimethyltransferase
MTQRPLPPRAQVSRRLRELALSPRKGLGQHFLADHRALERILDAAEITSSDTVVEVGPGLGVLTAALASRAGRVVAVEMDDELVAALQRDFASYGNLSIVQGDARELDVDALIGPGTPFKFVANLPYYAANPILRRVLEARHKPSLAVVMVQKEVAEQMAAQPGDMSLLSVGVQLYGSPRIVASVPPGSFVPPPKVTSAVVRIDVYPRPPVDVDDEAAFFALVRAGFSAKRKQLHNPLAHGLGISVEEAQRLCARASIDSRRRSETLSLAEWAALYRAWRERGSP